MKNKTITNNFLIIILSLLLFSFHSHVAYGTSYNRPISLDDLTKEAEWIVLAKVKKLRSYYTPLDEEQSMSQFLGRHHEIIETEISLEVVKSYKGDLSGEFVLNQTGGCVLDKCFRMSVSPVFPTFKAGKEVVLFLKEKNGTDQMVLVYGEFGVRKVTNDNQVEGWNLSLDNLEQEIKQQVEDVNVPENNLAQPVNDQVMNDSINNQADGLDTSVDNLDQDQQVNLIDF